MALLTSHVDRQLVHLATEGVLPPWQWRRVLRHARGCARCGAHYERVMHLHRVLARDTVTEPSPGELESLAARGLPAVLGATELESRAGGVARAWATVRAWWARVWETPSLGHVGGAWVLSLTVVGALLLLVRPHVEEEWGTRGEGQGATALRLFCVPEAAELREVRGGGECPAGASLAFAAGVRAPYTHVAVSLRTTKGVRVEGPFEVKAPPGAEVALDLTPRLSEAGEVEVTTVFASSAAAALGAARGETGHDVVSVRHLVRVGGKP